MTQDEIIRMAREADLDVYDPPIDLLQRFAKLVEQHVRRTMNDEAKAHLEELRKNFNVESAELRLHQWSQEKQA